MLEFGGNLPIPGSISTSSRNARSRSEDSTSRPRDSGALCLFTANAVGWPEMTNYGAQESHESGRYVITSQVLARNASINVVAQLIVALTAIVLLPIVVKELGEDAYGLLSLALVVFSSFSLLDLGLGRTTTKFVAEHLAKGDLDSIGPIIWTSFGIQVAIGGLAGLVFGLSASWLTHRVLNVAPTLIFDAEKTLLILAIAIPVGLGSFSLRGALEGAQRFDLVNYIKVSLNLSTYILPFLGARLVSQSADYRVLDADGKNLIYCCIWNRLFAYDSGTSTKSDPLGSRPGTQIIRFCWMGCHLESCGTAADSGRSLLSRISNFGCESYLLYCAI